MITAVDHFILEPPFSGTVFICPDMCICMTLLFYNNTIMLIVVPVVGNTNVLTELDGLQHHGELLNKTL